MNQIDLQGRVAVVTGGAQGIGFATCERLLRSGASVVMWDIDGAKINEAKALLSELGPISGYVVELTSDAAVAATTAQTIKDLGRIDILVNNAGITGGNATTWELDPEVWRRVIEVNLIAPYLTCRAVTPHMIERGWGRIINIASVAGKEGNPNASHYSASKAGVIALTMTEAHIAYMLGKIPMGRFVEVEEIAAMVAWLSSEDCSFTTGSVFDITGGRSTY
jgi:2-dehydro-3-deoxy-L-rhamnonate dehydrogenase (NAD+)